MTGLYVHIPFCSVKCHYCDFVTAPADSPLRAGFFGALETEIARVRSAFEGTVFDTLYLGGGTPSVLSLEELERLFGTLRGNFRFETGAEITMEMNPGDYSHDAETKNFASLREWGVNRVSLGAQTFHDKTLKRINRAHTAADTILTFQALRDAGFGNISLDLMLSLPGESVFDVRFSLERAAALGPEHVSLYELVVEERTHFGALRRAGRLKLPPEEEQTAVLLWARDFFKRNGFKHYELLSYCRPGFESRHNLIYWANGEYLGLGPGAWSYYGGRRFKRASRVDAYMKRMSEGDFSAEEEETLDADRRQVESFLLALRLIDGVHVGAPLHRQQQIASLIGQGLLENIDDGVRLTDRGILFAETVFRELC